MKDFRLIPALVLTAAALIGNTIPASAACIAARRIFEVTEAAKIPFKQPADLVLADNRLLVLDDLNSRIALLDLRGRQIGTLPLPTAKDDSYLGLGFGGADQIFLSAAEGGRIMVVDLKGRLVREFSVGDPDKLAQPTGVLVSRTSCFVVDNAWHRIRVFALDGKLLTEWGGLGEGPQQFRAPFRIVQDSLDRVFVSDVLNSRIQVFTPKGEPLRSFGEFGTTEGTLFRPGGLAVLEDDRILVADNYFGSLQQFDAEGTYEGVFCGPEGRPLALENPVSIAVRGRTVFVLEMGGGRVSAFEIDRK